MRQYWPSYTLVVPTFKASWWIFIILKSYEYLQIPSNTSICPPPICICWVGQWLSWQHGLHPRSGPQKYSSGPHKVIGLSGTARICALTKSWPSIRIKQMKTIFILWVKFQVKLLIITSTKSHWFKMLVFSTWVLYLSIFRRKCCTVKTGLKNNTFMS